MPKLLPSYRRHEQRVRRLLQVLNAGVKTLEQHATCVNADIGLQWAIALLSRLELDLDIAIQHALETSDDIGERLRKGEARHE